MFQSLSSNRKPLTGMAMGMVAMGSMGIMSAAMACELILPDQKAMAQSAPPTQIAVSHPLAIALAAAQKDGYVPEGTWKETIEISHDSAENPTNATVMITQTGFLDDSVKGHRFTISLSKNEFGDWTLNNIDKTWLCSRGMGDSGLCL